MTGNSAAKRDVPGCGGEPKITNEKQYEDYNGASATARDNHGFTRCFKHGGSIVAAGTTTAGATNETRSRPGANGADPARQQPTAHL